jgi:hypothetical protein
MEKSAPLFFGIHRVFSEAGCFSTAIIQSVPAGCFMPRIPIISCAGAFQAHAPGSSGSSHRHFDTDACDSKERIAESSGKLHRRTGVGAGD